MGGSTVLMEAARNPEIQVAVVDSPYGDLPKLLENQLSKHSGLPSWFNPGILLAARWVFGVRTDDLVPIRLARAWGERPVLLIHGESDTIVPVGQAHELARTLGSLVPDGHAARRRARPGLPERSAGLHPDGQLVLHGPPQPMRHGPSDAVRSGRARLRPSRFRRAARQEPRPPEDRTRSETSGLRAGRASDEPTVDARPGRLRERDTGCRPDQGPTPPWVRYGVRCEG